LFDNQEKIDRSAVMLGGLFFVRT